MSEEKIVVLVHDEECIDSNQDDSDVDNEEGERKPTHAQAFTTAMAWCENKLNAIQKTFVKEEARSHSDKMDINNDLGIHY